jgi:hypothetical protein
MDNEKYQIKAILSDKADEKFISDFCYACNTTFGEGAMSRSVFDKKFIDNIYGNSILCVCYDLDGNVAGARAFWRNDVEGKLAYQPCDTCVLKEYRRQGLFEKMTDAAIKLTEADSVEYNFPNDNSRHLYFKHGWSVYGVFKPKLLLSYKAYHLEHDEIMSQEYFNWWLNNRGFSCTKLYGHYFLIKNYGRFFHIVVAEITAKTASLLPKATPKLLLFWSLKKTFYNKNKETKIVVFNSKYHIHIPLWKMDVI